MKNTNRRKFLQTAAIGTGALAIGAAAFPNLLTRKKKEKIGVALVGLGYYSTDVLAPALQLTQHCYLAGIVTGTPEKAVRWKRQYDIPEKNIYNYENMDGIANNPEIDVVYIVLPTGLHAQYAVKAADTGKHVWCEKPMARTVAECQSIIDACNKNQVKLAIGYRMQHEPNTQTVIRFGKEKTYGNIKKVEAAAGYRDGRSNHWKLKKEMGGGALYDMGVYPINAVRYVTNEEPMAVIQAEHSTTRPQVYTEVDETTRFQLEFPSGAVAECETSFGKGMNRLHVTAEKGWYRLQPFQSYSGVRGETSDGILLNKRIANQQAKQMDDDALSILNDTDMLVPGEEGLNDIKVVEAVYESAAKGERVLIK
ncbi:MAG: Gfo/Idh/MocA family oxidoreductase [Bacteroidota bacterium]